MSCKRIRLVVKDSADESSYVPVLEAAGYVLQIREPDWFEHRLFKGPDTDINLHVFSLGTSEIDRMLRFRDWLRTNDTDRDKYAQVKRSLAKNKWRHVQHYANAKTSIVQEIMKRANGALLKVEPKYMLLGGAIGAFITYTVIRSMEMLGPAKAAMLIVVAQLIVAYVIELLGWFGVEKQPLEWRKVVGMAVAIVGIVVFKWE